MGSVYVLLYDVTNLFSINVVLFKKYIFLLIGSDIKYVIDTSR